VEEGLVSQLLEQQELVALVETVEMVIVKL
jgi:hypothetical protein